MRLSQSLARQIRFKVCNAVRNFRERGRWRRRPHCPRGFEPRVDFLVQVHDLPDVLGAVLVEIRRSRAQQRRRFRGVLFDHFQFVVECLGLVGETKKTFARLLIDRLRFKARGRFLVQRRYRWRRVR